jgi:hypothetical protein
MTGGPERGIMLDLNHPMTTYIFQASGLIDRVMIVAQQMTVSPSSVRQELLEKCLIRFNEMRALNIDHFQERSFVAQAIDEYEVGLKTLAALGGGQIVEDRRDGEGDCPYCGTKIMKFRASKYEESFIVLCPQCSKCYMVALEKLRSYEGFGTESI